MESQTLKEYLERTKNAELSPDGMLGALTATNMFIKTSQWEKVKQEHLKTICFHARIPEEHVNNPHGGMDINASLIRASGQKEIRDKIYGVLRPLGRKPYKATLRKRYKY